MTHAVNPGAQPEPTGDPGRPSVCALMTSFNRKDMTLASIAALAASAQHARVPLRVVLVDDASTDGTAGAVLARFPWVQVESGDGSLFWCRGMHRAMAIGLAHQHDFYLWLNDDTLLQRDSIRRLLDCEQAIRLQHGSAPIVVGSTVDAITGAPSYGGTIRPLAWLPMHFRHVVPGREPRRCDTMTGNIVLMSREIPSSMGNLDPRFEHAMGDTDYGLRACRHGFGIWVAPGTHGFCSDNPRTGTFRDRNLSLRERWIHAMSRKGLPWRSWLIVTRRHAGALWPLHFAWPYLRLLGSCAMSAGRASVQRFSP